MAEGSNTIPSSSNSSVEVDEKLAGVVDAEESHQTEEHHRGTWSGKCDFFMSCLSYAVGLGNLWRFPYLCYQNGGGAFLIPYFFMMVFAGMPLFLIELSLGQFCGKGLVRVWRFSPIFTGLGYGMVIVSLLVMFYYNMVIAWSFYYVFASFAADVPWKTCQNSWNTPSCSEASQFKNCSSVNGTWYNQTCWSMQEHGNETFSYYKDQVQKFGRHSASYEYFHKRVLNLSSGFTDMGAPSWELALCLLLGWILVFLLLVRGIKSSGKAVYFTAMFPYVVLIILLGKAATLEGAGNGVLYYITPKWEKLAEAKVWGDAAVQVFFSLSPCWGGLITLSSYNPFNNNVVRDVVILTLANIGTSIFAGFVIFSVIGFMANELSITIEQVAVKGAGLAFVVYPEVVAQLPISPLWSILFFLMLINLGVGTQMTTVNTVFSFLLDLQPQKLRKGHIPKLVLAGLCLVGFLGGLILCCRGGMFMLQLMDNYAATYSTLLLGVVECVAVGYIYGWHSFAEDVKLMIGVRPSVWWRAMIQAITPTIVFFILVFTFVEFTRTSYDGIVIPEWADAMGWLMVLVGLLPVPIYAIYLAYKHHDGSVLQTLRHISRPSPKWGPSPLSGIQNSYKPYDFIMSASSQKPLGLTSVEELPLQAEGQDV